MLKRVWRIIFDYDGTLINHYPGRELEIMADYLEIKRREEFILQMTAYYTSLPESMHNKVITRKSYNEYMYRKLPFLTEYGFTPNDIMEAQIYKDTKINLINEDAVSVLDYLKGRGYYLCILTNGFCDEQIKSIKVFGLYDYFDKIFCWDNCYPKPNPKAFLRALALTDPRDNAMVGNNMTDDIIPAKEQGIYTFGINIPKVRNTNPDIELNRLKDIKLYL